MLYLLLRNIVVDTNRFWQGIVLTTLTPWKKRSQTRDTVVPSDIDYLVIRTLTLTYSWSWLAYQGTLFIIQYLYISSRNDEVWDSHGFTPIGLDFLHVSYWCALSPSYSQYIPDRHFVVMPHFPIIKTPSFSYNWSTCARQHGPTELYIGKFTWRIKQSKLFFHPISCR